MAGASIRGFGDPGKLPPFDAVFAYPEALLARARTMASAEAARAGISVAEGVRQLREAYILSRDRIPDVARTKARYVGGPFFVVRDLPKAMSVGYELAARDLLPARRTARVLDLGAGLGTTTFGFARLARMLGTYDALDVDAVDLDAGVLERMRALATPDDDLVPITLRTHASTLESFLEAGRGSEYDLILVGLALNELASDPERRFGLVQKAISRLSNDGCLVVIEPALHETTRALMALRDRLVAARHEVAVPCTHRCACPMIAAGDRDWCHFELDLALPPPEAAVADAVGLRDERLTFSPLVVTKRRTDTVPLHRLVSRPLGSKGKTEAFACGGETLVRLRELDRDARGGGLSSLRRGTLVRLDPAGSTKEALRLGRDAALDVVVP